MWELFVQSGPVGEHIHVLSIYKYISYIINIYRFKNNIYIYIYNKLHHNHYSQLKMIICNI